jgi:hypothetical protein
MLPSKYQVFYYFTCLPIREHIKHHCAAVFISNTTKYIQLHNKYCLYYEILTAVPDAVTISIPLSAPSTS